MNDGLLFLALDNPPAFFLASVIAYVFAVRLGWFPLYGARAVHGVARDAARPGRHRPPPRAAGPRPGLQYVTFQYLVMRASMFGEPGRSRARARQGLEDRILKYRYADAARCCRPSRCSAARPDGDQHGDLRRDGFA